MPLLLCASRDAYPGQPEGSEIAQQQGEQAVNATKESAGVFRVGDVLKDTVKEAKKAQTDIVRCSKDGTLPPAGTKFCLECGTCTDD